MDPRIARLFNQPSSQPSKIPGKGSIVTFNYVGQSRYRIHDPYPLVIISDIFSDTLRGLNLHYCTLPYVQRIVSNFASNPQFSYAYIKNDDYIVGAFRSYKRSGMSQLKMLDTGFLKNLLTVVRALDVGEIDAIKNQIQELMREQNQPLAQPGPEMR